MFQVTCGIRDLLIATLSNERVKFLNTRVGNGQFQLDLCRLVRRNGKLNIFERGLDRVKSVAGNGALDAWHEQVNAGEKEDHDNKERRQHGRTHKILRSVEPSEQPSSPIHRRLSPVQCINRLRTGERRAGGSDEVAFAVHRANCLIVRHGASASCAFREVRDDTRRRRGIQFIAGET